MSKRERLTMDAFSPAQQPDEGYSEDPLNPMIQHELVPALATLKSPSDLPSWISANASHLPMSLKRELAMALLSELPTSSISEIVDKLSPRLYIDFIRYLPPEICLKILSYLDPVSLVCVIRTCRGWCDLALDSKLWEGLYHLEGWKASWAHIESCEAVVNVGLNDSIGYLHRIQSSEGHTSKIRALVSEDEDTDVSMSDTDRVRSADESSAASIFGSPSSSMSNKRPAVTPLGEMDLDRPSSKARSSERSTRPEPGAKRKDRHATPDSSLPPILPAQDPRTVKRSTLWMWDGKQSRYRMNWKYLYNMRRRLESNWELGKAVPFTFPHPHFPQEGHQECVYSLQFDANYLVSGSRDHTMRIWNIHNRRLCRPPLTGHRGSVLCLQFDAAPEEDLLVSGSSDATVIIWKFSTGEQIQRIRAHHESVLNVRFDKRILVTSSKDKSIKIFNRRPLRYGDLGYKDDVFGPVAKNVRRYGYEPELARELPVRAPFTQIGRLDGHGAAVNAIQVRDRTVVSVSGDRHIKVWNWPDQICTQTIPAHDKGIACVEFDGRRIVSGSSDYEVCIFDAPTGLKVAQLRGHSNLVRTVQAGFGDLPYSRIEDEAEARRVDAEYFKAVDAGLVEHNDRPRRRNRRPNAGSSNPLDLQAYGAKLPPGGGGGRTYGRIVSGSYDQSIIIWRRDKEGVWKPAHHLRQEEAATAAQQREPPPPTTTQTLARHASSQQPSLTPGLEPPPSGVHTALIDEIVPAGPASLQRALVNFPDLLANHDYLQASIEREASQITRAQLRQVVADSLITMQNKKRNEGTAGIHPPSDPTASTAGSAASQRAADPGLSSQQPVASPTATPQPPLAQAAVPTPNPEAQAPAQDQSDAPPPPLPQAGDGQAQAGPQQGAGNAHENGPARVFKLQFDARKIICCSQAPVIVGWDFCNGDPELEEVSRFFASID